MGMPTKNHRIWVVGATGLVGRAILDILLNEWKVSPQQVECLASPRRAGHEFNFEGHIFKLHAPQPVLFNESEHHFVLLATDAEISREWVQFISHTHIDHKITNHIPHHVTIIDSSSAFRMTPEIPLIIAGINEAQLTPANHLVASPNCTTIGLLLGIHPFWKQLSVKRLFVSTYQAASGAGQRALEALASDLKSGGTDSNEYFPYPLANECIPEIGGFNDAGFTTEEMKVLQESHKILNTTIPIHVTCSRIPVAIGHSESVTLELAEPLTHESLTKVVQASTAPSVKISEPFSGSLPLQSVIHTDAVTLSRIRIHPTDPTFLHAWIQFDNIRIGAATNVCRIVQAMM
jgi:aspartate-semialdehyde dehydrogenase